MNKPPVQLLKTTTVKIRRRADGFYNNRGYFQPGDPCDIEIKANVQSLSGREILQMPEGDRQKEHNWMYTTQKVLVNDVVCYKNEMYEVRSVADWTDFSLAHYRSLIVRLEKQDETV